MLKGQWRFDRNAIPGPEMTGTAMFTENSDGRLSYFEEGVNLTTGLPFTRAYDYEFVGPDMSVFYADGLQKGRRFLHFENADRGYFPCVAHADHLCDQDHYAATFTFAAKDRFLTRYDVMGPRKNYSLSTVYRKL